MERAETKPKPEGDPERERKLETSVRFGHLVEADAQMAGELAESMKGDAEPQQQEAELRKRKNVLTSRFASSMLAASIVFGVLGVGERKAEAAGQERRGPTLAEIQRRETARYFVAVAADQALRVIDTHVYESYSRIEKKAYQLAFIQERIREMSVERSKLAAEFGGVDTKLFTLEQELGLTPGYREYAKNNYEYWSLKFERTILKADIAEGGTENPALPAQSARVAWIEGRMDQLFMELDVQAKELKVDPKNAPQAINDYVLAGFKHVRLYHKIMRLNEGIGAWKREGERLATELKEEKGPGWKSQAAKWGIYAASIGADILLTPRY